MQLFVLLVFAGLLTLFPVAFAKAGDNAMKKKKVLEEKKKKIQQEIEFKKKLLEEVKGSKSKTMLQLAIINNQIKDREDLISTLNNELTVLSMQISEKKAAIKTAEDKMSRLKQEYAQMVIMTYKNRSSFDRLMFLFSSNDFNQAYKRLTYFEEYGRLRKKQADEIGLHKKQLAEKVQELETKKAEQNSLLGESKDERNNLTKEKVNKEVVITDLKQKEKELKDEVRLKKQMAEKVKKEIDALIEEELKKYVTKTPGKKDPVKKAPKIVLTPEEQLINNSFEGNQGKLPWPMKEGVITQGFGTYEHPDLAGVVLNNNGVDITTNKGSTARSIFDGVVVVAGSLGAMSGKVIIIKHGEYFSVYQGLEEVYVKKGDKVKTKQELGKVSTDEDNKTELHFEIYKGKSLMNPESWISKG